MNKLLENKIAVVSGFGKGIGRETAIHFARQGATVIGTEISEELTEKSVAEAAKEGLHIHGIAPADMFDEPSVKETIKAIGEEYGRIDVLINCASAVKMVPFEDMTFSDFEWTMRAEVGSAFMVSHAAWPYLKINGGSVINFASVAAHRGNFGLPAMAHSAGKGAVLAMTRQLALDGGPFGIRANSISPGFVVTESNEYNLKNTKFIDNLKSKLSISRLGEPADIASGCVYLASDMSTWVTGIDLAIDGGMMAR